jgi:LDH2 family malate/lactate/ureidoglycolate dehydrogenase
VETTAQVGPVEVAVEPLRRFGRLAYEHAGMTPDDARLVVDVQLTADQRGVDTHGFQRLPWYVERLVKGENKARPVLRAIKETPVSLVVDGDNGLGQLICVRLMEMTLAKARTAGMAVGTLRNSNDWGCGGYYPMMAAAQGYVSFCTTTSIPTLAPYGGRTRMTGNNPMAFAVPRRNAPPIVLDMALTPVALGKVMRARAEGQPIPEAWGFLTKDGEPTTDPATALGGIIPAIGGYKGTGLSLMMNLLAGVLPGGFHSGAVEPSKRGQFFLVISPELFGDRETFFDEVESMAAQVKRSEPLPAVSDVFLPGELEQRQFDERVRRGSIPYPRSVVSELEALGASIGIPFER